MRNGPGIGLSLFLSAALAAPGVAQDRWVVRADTVYTAAGDPIADGVVVVADGKISAVGTSGGGGTTLEVAAVTPGLIDLSAGIGTGDYSVEQSDETALEYEVAESIDLFSYRWERELRNGVTTVLAAPLDMNVFGGLCTVLKTGGTPTLEARSLATGAALRAAIGTQPSSGNYPPRGSSPQDFYARRPTTRMGVEWVFRNAYYEALNAQRFDLEVNELQASRNEVLMRTIEGELPLIVQARATQDVRTAIYLKEEFGIANVILDEAVEAWKEPELVQRSGVGVILPPHPKNGRVADAYANDSYFLALDSASRLFDLGVTVALSGNGARSAESRLARQAGYAMRGGLSFEAALAAVTINPARMVGVDDRVGSIEVGKDADLVLWSGKPFEPTSGVIGVLLNGELVVDPRPADESE
jgi:imidazolonepropionase-like amidohydrolase